MILKTRALEKSLSSVWRRHFGLSSRSKPWTGGMSIGDGQELNDGVEHALHALVLEGGAAKHRA